jgi:hypothetical protein
VLIRLRLLLLEGHLELELELELELGLELELELKLEFVNGLHLLTPVNCQLRKLQLKPVSMKKP